MESIGEKLKTARESKGYSLEQVARDTHIAKRFLTALEGEDFSMFPGEPYLIGFLRNYAEYLGLSAQEIVSLYKNLKLQEQPAPMDELLERPKSRVPWFVGGGVLILAAVVVGIVLFVGGKASPGASQTAAAKVAAPKAANASPIASGQVYSFQGGMKEQAFRRGDAITVQSGGHEYRLVLTSIGKTVTFSTPTGVIEIAPNEEKVVDLTGDGRPDVKLLVRSITSQDSTPSAVVRIDSAVQSSVASVAGGNGTAPADAQSGDQSQQNQQQTTATAPAATAPAATVPTTPAPTPVPQAAVSPDTTVIATMDQQQPFTVNFTFTSPALFRYAVDNGQRQERYYDAGETFSTTATSKFELWLSNSAAAQVVVAGNVVSLGSGGEVAADVIQWSDSGNGYRLILVPMN